MSYEHTQTGRALLLILAVAVAVSAAAAASGASRTVLWILPVLALVTWLFSSLTVTVGKDRVALRFGPGLIRVGWSLREIAAARPVTTPWYCGLGIHFTPDGWLFNVGGSGAVEITLRSGRRRRIGTDEPEVLARAIRRAAGLEA